MPLPPRQGGAGVGDEMDHTHPSLLPTEPLSSQHLRPLPQRNLPIDSSFGLLNDIFKLSL